MKSPQDMRIIQIDITNACIHRCSNCTRFCGHHKKPFFMDFETFQKAVDSFEGYNGTVGIMGGEPTLHPEFERFLLYLNEHKYYPKTENLLVEPTDRFMHVIAQMEQRDTFINHDHGIDRRCVQGYGLWSALSGNYLKHYELIQDTFNFQACNDHTNIMYHSPIMVRRKDLGVSDEAWPGIRDNCWAQKEWSATITPKGAFFCEIAGALDMLFDGPGGWPIEPGWWKRQPEEFGDQLRWCELCGITMSTFTRDANEEIDDMSPWYLERLKELKSPKVSQGMYNVLDIDENGAISDKTKIGARETRTYHYSDSYFSRFNNNWLNPTEIIGLVIVEDDSRIGRYENAIRTAERYLDGVVVVSGLEAAELRRGLLPESEKSIALHEPCVTFGTRVNKALRNLSAGQNPFLVVLDENSVVEEGCADFLKGYVLNPGSILTEAADPYIEERLGRRLRAVFSPHARALRLATAPVAGAVNDVESFAGLWPRNKRVPLERSRFESTGYAIEPTVRYALYGCGPTAEKLLPSFREGQIVLAADSDCGKWGEKFHGYTISSPEELMRATDTFDKVFVASRYYFEIKDTLMGMGLPAERIVTSINAM